MFLTEMQDFCFLTLVLKSVKMKKDHLKLLKKILMTIDIICMDKEIF